MNDVKNAEKIESIVAQMHELSEQEQRSLAGTVLQDRKLEAFVEELDDHLSCERAAEGSLELFTP